MGYVSLEERSYVIFNISDVGVNYYLQSNKPSIIQPAINSIESSRNTPHTLLNRSYNNYYKSLDYKANTSEMASHQMCDNNETITLEEASDIDLHYSLFGDYDEEFDGDGEYL